MNNSDNSSICAFCKYFQDNDAANKVGKCMLTGKFTQQGSTCNNFMHMYLDNESSFFTDINDDLDYYD